MAQRGTLVFDNDDTLVATIWTYDVSYASFYKFLAETLPGRAPSLYDVIERLAEIEAELSKTWGIKRGRVAESMASLYREVCDWIKERHDEDCYMKAHEDEIRRIGDIPFGYSGHHWLPKVRYTLEILENKGYNLCLLTSYDTDLFLERAKYIGLDRFFGNRMRFIEGKKTAEDFKLASGWDPLDKDRLYYAIGNGESDIRPALEISEQWHGIYIPHRNTSPFFNRGGKKVSFDAEPIDHPRVTNVKTFTDLLDHL